MNAPIHGRPSMTGYQIARATRDRNAVYWASPDAYSDLRPTRHVVIEPRNPQGIAWMTLLSWLVIGIGYVLIVSKSL